MVIQDWALIKFLTFSATQVYFPLIYKRRKSALYTEYFSTAFKGWERFVFKVGRTLTFLAIRVGAYFRGECLFVLGCIGAYSKKYGTI